MDYSEKTAELIERMCQNVERESFVLDKEKSEELILKTYDLFDLPRPKKIAWCNSPFDEKFARSAGSARSARSAWSAGSAWSAWSAGSARSARSAWSAGSARSARSAWSARSAGSAGSARSAWSAWSAGSAGSAGSARSAWSALDYDFDWFVIEHEYCENPDKEFPVNGNDKIYLDYCDLLMQAKEAGLGFRVEWEDTLYLAPTPLVKIDELNRFHSERQAAIIWENDEYFYLHGVKFEKKLWKKVVSGKMSFSEILKIENTEQRLQAMRHNPNALMQEKPKLIHKSERGNELYVIEGSEVNTFYDAPKVYLLGFIDPSKEAPNNMMYEEVSPEDAERTQNADEINAIHCRLTLEEYKQLQYES